MLVLSGSIIIVILPISCQGSGTRSPA